MRRRWQRAALGVSLGAALMATAGAALVLRKPLLSAWHLHRLIQQLRSPSPEEVSIAFHSLVKKGDEAIPKLESYLSDREVRSACVEIITRIGGSRGESVLVNWLKRCISEASVDERFKWCIVGGLGRLRAKTAEALLEQIYKENGNAQSTMSLSVAWALKEITGRDYGPAYDPWEQGK